MWQYVDEVRAMMQDAVALCTPPGAAPTYIRDVKAYYAALPLSEDDRRSLQPLLDDRLRTRKCELMLRKVYAVSGIVIPYV